MWNRYLRLVFTWFICLTLVTAHSQNLVPNNGFENYSSLPNGYGQWYKLNGWYNLNGFMGFVWPYASPDFLHLTGSGGVDLPVCTFATVNPFAGNAVMGFNTWNGTAPEFREYSAIQLSSPMVPGVEYEVSMWITNGSSGWYCGASSNRIGMRLTLTMLTQTDHEPIGGIPQCEYAGEIWSTTWQYISFLYTPDQPYEYLTIGNFYNDAATSHTTHYAGAMTNAAYYFMDEIVVMESGILPITLTQFNAFQAERNIVLNWETTSEINNQYFLLEKGKDGNSFGELAWVPAAGYSSEPVSYKFTDSLPDEGVNFYRLTAVDFNGRKHESEIASVFFEQEASRIHVYPNPCSSVLTVNMGETGLRHISLYNAMGRIVFGANTSAKELTIDVSNMDRGIYFLQVRDESSVITEEIIIN